MSLKSDEIRETVILQHSNDDFNCNLLIVIFISLLIQTF